MIKCEYQSGRVPLSFLPVVHGMFAFGVRNGPQMKPLQPLNWYVDARIRTDRQTERQTDGRMEGGKDEDTEIEIDRYRRR